MRELESEIEDYAQRIEHHKALIAQIHMTMPASRVRSLAARASMVLVTGLIALACTATNTWIWPALVILVGTSMVWGYQSSEIDNLKSSLSQHDEDLARLEGKHATAAERLASLTASTFAS
jgi:hypothetical protein